jgi:hypothetical protein
MALTSKTLPIDKRYLVATGEPLVYGTEGKQLVFAPLRLVLDLALTHAVQSFSGTWGEMRLRLPVHRLQKFEHDWEENSEAIPGNEAPPSESDRDYLAMAGEPRLPACRIIYPPAFARRSGISRGRWGRWYSCLWIPTVRTRLFNAWHKTASNAFGTTS